MDGRARAATAASPGSRACAVVARLVGACVEAKGVACRRCAEACDPVAISYRPLSGGRVRTTIDVERCEGCGACVATCPMQALALAPRESVALGRALAAYARGDAPGVTP
jgi:ferredoxin